ncbi:solute carrier family 22 member 2-like isoform X2 [Hypanus sabinus]|uniref:solute carrier family 22 member 2-like isoform X2 n=1 Tax=Hypanus sabinus TaxID=79690 RepID=UPI0028C434DE|nr:solute carrier family 22 member 2-like isoform X2 [Hypanus sabinus]
MATFDDLLVEAGGFGPYQSRVFLLIYLSSAVFSWLYVGFVFLAITPDHWCRSPGVAELREKCNWSLNQERNYTLPAGHPAISSYSQCERFDLDWNSSSISCDNPLPFSRNHSRDLPVTTCQDGWEFENGSISSIVTEIRPQVLLLVCNFCDRGLGSPAGLCSKLPLVCDSTHSTGGLQSGRIPVCQHLNDRTGCAQTQEAGRDCEPDGVQYRDHGPSGSGLLISGLEEPAAHHHHPKHPLPHLLLTITVEESDGQVTRPSVLDLFRTPRIRRHTLILMMNWFACALVYQGLIMHLGTLGGNIYLDFFISGAVEIPASIIVLLVIERIGRRLPFATGGLLSGASCLIAAFIPDNVLWLKTVVAFLGRLGITVTMEMVCFVNMELYPTYLRSFAVSFCASLSDFGGVLSPFVVFRLSALWRRMPLVVFGVFGLVSGGLVLLLPETKGLSLPDTIEKIENINWWKQNTSERTYQKVVLRSTTPTHGADSSS